LDPPVVFAAPVVLDPPVVFAAPVVLDPPVVFAAPVVLEPPVVFAAPAPDRFALAAPPAVACIDPVLGAPGESAPEHAGTNTLAARAASERARR
jgi:hypothetical protein